MVELSTNVRTKMKEFGDASINSWGVRTKIVYPPVYINCSSCSPNLVGYSSGSIYKRGGPAPTNLSECPVCGGTNRVEQEYSDIIRTKVMAVHKTWIQPDGLPINIPNMILKIKGFIYDLPNVLKANYFIVDLDNEGIRDFRYQLDGEPFSKGLGHDRYFNATLKRVV